MEQDTVIKETIESLRAKKFVAALGSDPLASDVTEWISTQIPSLNVAIGRPGIPAGRITNLYGEEASGKSTVGLHLLAEAQRIGGYAILLDAENRYFREWGERVGIDHDRLIVLQPDTLEDGFAEIDAVIEEIRDRDLKGPVVIVWDSLSASIPKTLDADPTGAAAVAAYGRPVSRWLPKLHQNIARKRVAVVIINQLRSKVQIGGWSFDRQQTQVADGALRYYASLRLYCKSIRKIGSADAPEGMEIETVVQKNTVAPPGRKARYHILFDRGADIVASALDVAVEIGEVERAGSWYKRRGNSFRSDAFAKVLADDSELRKAIEEAPLRWMKGLPSGERMPS